MVGNDPLLTAQFLDLGEITIEHVMAARLDRRMDVLVSGEALGTPDLGEADMHRR